MMKGRWVVILAILGSLVKSADLTTVVHNESLQTGWGMNTIEIEEVTHARYTVIMSNGIEEETLGKTRWGKKDKGLGLLTNVNLHKIIEDLQKDMKDATKGPQ